MNNIVVTLDVDWAPDFAIDFVAEKLIAHDIRATWFITHLSPAIERLRRYPEFFELGIHPNFLSGSTHGTTPEQVLLHCMTLVPDAVSLRTHALVQSAPLLDLIMTQTPIQTDASLQLPYAPHLCPVEYQRHGRSLLRVPFCWEDDDETERLCPSWHLAEILATGDGLKVFDFHPIHVYLNSADMKPYEALKQRVPKLSEAEMSEASDFVQERDGTQTIFNELVKHLADHRKSSCIRDIYERWKNGS